jgi:hypothetical protein
MAPISGVSCIPLALPDASRAVHSREDVMFELNFSSNADWLVAVLLAVTVVAAFI